MKIVIAFILSIGLIFLVTWSIAGQADESGKREASAHIILFSITSSPQEDPHSVTMALQLAGHALDDGREVVLFFNVRGVKAVMESLPDDLAFKDKPIKLMLAKLIDRGAQAHVCPHCMNALDVTAEDLVRGIVVTDREKLFSKIGSNTVVFTY